MKIQSSYSFLSYGGYLTHLMRKLDTWLFVQGFGRPAADWSGAAVRPRRTAPVASGAGCGKNGRAGTPKPLRAIVAAFFVVRFWRPSTTLVLVDSLSAATALRLLGFGPPWPIVATH